MRIASFDSPWKPFWVFPTHVYVLPFIPGPSPLTVIVFEVSPFITFSSNFQVNITSVSPPNTLHLIWTVSDSFTETDAGIDKPKDTVRQKKKWREYMIKTYKNPKKSKQCTLYRRAILFRINLWMTRWINYYIPSNVFEVEFFDRPSTVTWQWYDPLCFVCRGLTIVFAFSVTIILSWYRV